MTTYRFEWLYVTLQRPSKLWQLASTITFAAVGIFSKIIIEWLNTTKVYNKDIIESAIDRRPSQVPLITVSNHHSCFDDPGLWGIQVEKTAPSFMLSLNFGDETRIVVTDAGAAIRRALMHIGTLSLRYLCNRKKIRWSLAAHDICFTNVYHSYFFALGKCIPVIRGNGVYQKAIDFCIDKLKIGEWVHVFPEGRVNMAKEFMRIKWGVGRMIYESPIMPVVIPMWHIGMDSVLPNDPPYMLRIKNKVTLNFGKPIDFGDMIQQLRSKNVSDEEARKTITERIQDELYQLKSQTEELHLKNQNS